MFFLHQMLHLKIYIGETSHSSKTLRRTQSHRRHLNCHHPLLSHLARVLSKH